MNTDAGSNENTLARRGYDEPDMAEWTAKILIGVHTLRQMVAQTRLRDERLLLTRATAPPARGVFFDPVPTARPESGTTERRPAEMNPDCAEAARAVSNL
jgi:hypothetical protein